MSVWVSTSTQMSVCIRVGSKYEKMKVVTLSVFQDDLDLLLDNPSSLTVTVRTTCSSFIA